MSNGTRGSRRKRNERGAAMVLGAIFFTFLALPLCALSIDTARWWVEAQRLQAAADAAATAGVTYMPEDFDSAKARAIEFAKINGYTVGSGTTITVSAGERPTQLKVSLTTTVDNFFAKSFGKAMITSTPVEVLEVPLGRLLLQTLRSHDQFNTTIYGLDDRYRGVKNGRRVVFVHPEDIRSLGLEDGDTVDLVSEWRDGTERKAKAFRIVSYDQPRGCAAAYYPETNPLVPLDSTATGSNQPAYKSVVVRLEHPGADSDGGSQGSPAQGAGSSRTDQPHHLS